MRRLLLWLLGLLLMGILAYYCFMNRSTGIKDALLEKAHSAYQAQDIDWVKTGLQGDGLGISRVLKLEGVAPSLELKNKAGQIARSVYGISGVNNRLTVLKTETPVAVVEPVIETVEMPVVAEIEIPSPYMFKAQKEKSGDVILTGYLADENMHDSILAKAEELFTKTHVDDQLKVIEGAPKGWRDTSVLGLEKLAGLDYGELSMSDMDISFSGYLADATEKETFLTSFKESLNGEYKASYDVEVPALQEIKVEPVIAAKSAVTTPTCQEQLTSMMATGNIQFNYDKSGIKPGSFKLLDGIAKIIKVCDKEMILIAGHTDSDGRATYNQKLSTKRATSVKKYLVSQGIKASRIEAIGFGESHPIASNKNDAGKEKNRRIEITVKGVAK